MILPRVTIVIPVFNGEAYLNTAISSVLAQNYADIELIVVDDGSTDGSAALAKGFGDSLRLIQQQNGGQSNALATGWAASTGSVIGYLSADDVLRPTAVNRGVEALAAHAETVLVYPDFDLIDEESRPIGTVFTPNYSRRALFAELHCLPGPGALFQKKAYERAGPWRTDLRHIPDLDFFLRLALEGDFFHIPEVLAQFRKHAESTTYRIVPFDRGEEPLRMVDEFYLRLQLPADVRSWRRPARASALLLSAIIHAQSGRTRLAIRKILAATATRPVSLFSRRTVAFVLTVLRAPSLKAAN
jgi:glycosyltransferase involved in cell wall biosynthesis